MEPGVIAAEENARGHPASRTRSAEVVLPATVHQDTFLRRDFVPFVGKVFLRNEHGRETQFSCVLTGVEKRACVTTAHSFLNGADIPQSENDRVVSLARAALTVEFDACEQVFTAENIELGTTEIDDISERHRERDIAIITLSDPACSGVNPVALFPRLDKTAAEKWLLPTAASRAPVTIVAFYMGCTLGAEPAGASDTCEQYSSTGFIDSIAYLSGEPVYETTSIATLPGSSGAPGLLIDTGADAHSRHDDTYFWICLNVGHRPGGANACLALENGSFARDFLESRIRFF